MASSGHTKVIQKIPKMSLFSEVNRIKKHLDIPEFLPYNCFILCVTKRNKILNNLLYYLQFEKVEANAQTRTKKLFYSILNLNQLISGTDVYKYG